MKLVQTQLKHILTHNQVVFIVRVEKLNSRESLVLKRHLFKEGINIKFISNKNLRYFFENFKNESFFSLLKGEIAFLFSKNLDWFKFYNLSKSRFLQIHFYCLYTYNRLFFLSNLTLRTKNTSLLTFLKQHLFNGLLKTIFMINYNIINLIKNQRSLLLNTLKRIKNVR
jgi:hypothetical protein